MVGQPGSRWLWVAVLLGVTRLVSGAPICSQENVSYSTFIGTKQSGARYIDHLPLAAKGNIRQLSLYFNKQSGCLRGAKAAVGSKPEPGMIGQSAGTSEVALKLSTGEYVTKAEYKANTCIEYVKVFTSKGRSVSVGSASAPSALKTFAGTKGQGKLIAIRGFQGMEGSKPSALQQLQFVWGTNKCRAEDLTAESGTLKGPEVAIAGGVPITTASHSTSSDGNTKTLHKAAGSVAQAVAVSNSHANSGQCAAKVDMCNENASMNQFSYCIWNAPFTKAACKGGCCYSSGKCASSSCAISGMGRDVANMICYGINSGFGFGGNNLCAGLACKLATPGCTTDAFGGNCVGEVVAFGNDKSAVPPESLRYIGAPCLDATPSDQTLDENGQPADNQGIYTGKLWTICDCSDGAVSTLTQETAAGLLNLTAKGFSNISKNEVMLAISQVLPQINLTEAVNLDGDGEEDPAKSLFPSFTDLINFPAMPRLSLPSLLGGGSNGTASASDGSVPALKLPDLSTLLGALAAKAATVNGTAQTASPAAAAADLAAAPAATEIPLPSSGSSLALRLPNLSSLLGSLANRAAAAAKPAAAAINPAAVGTAAAPSSGTESAMRLPNLNSLLGSLAPKAATVGSINSTTAAAAQKTAGQMAAGAVPAEQAASGGYVPDFSGIQSLLGKFMTALAPNTTFSNTTHVGNANSTSSTSTSTSSSASFNSRTNSTAPASSSSSSSSSAAPSNNSSSANTPTRSNVNSTTAALASSGPSTSVANPAETGSGTGSTNSAGSSTGVAGTSGSAGTGSTAAAGTPRTEAAPDSIAVTPGSTGRTGSTSNPNSTSTLGTTATLSATAAPQVPAPTPDNTGSTPAAADTTASSTPAPSAAALPRFLSGFSALPTVIYAVPDPALAAQLAQPASEQLPAQPVAEAAIPDTTGAAAPPEQQQQPEAASQILASAADVGAAQPQEMPAAAAATVPSAAKAAQPAAP